MSEWDGLHHIDGLFVGMLDEEERRLFHRAIRDGMAMTVFQGTSGLLGLGKVKVTQPSDATLSRS